MYYTYLDNEGWPIIGRNRIIVSNSCCSSEISYYSYTIKKHFFTSADLFEVANWASTHCNDIWLVGWNYSAFINKEDAIYFKLTWC